MTHILYRATSKPFRVLARQFRIARARRGCTLQNPVLDIGKRSYLKGENIRIGKNFKCYWDCRIVSQQSTVEIGNHVVFSHHVDVAAGPGGYIKIGDYCSIGQFVVLRNCAHAFDDPNRLIQEQGHKEGNIELGPDCYIAASAVILPNTKLGKGCVVGSGSVVSGSFPPYSVIVGHPGRIVKKRL